jgi:ABC-type multidrug transport system fused ATPase/permease subunit
MIELSNGSITIDGLDISQYPREIIRERLNAISQDPFFLKGSVRQNCDPRDSSTDEEILDVLDKVRLWDYIDSKGGLDAEVTQDFFSHGQKQLFCLARALLHRSRIVIMDEATSRYVITSVHHINATATNTEFSVDVDTDKILQELIRTSFKDATIIAVAHRLDTILDFDNVALIDKGVVVEYGNPQQLLARPSAFKALYDTYRDKDDEEREVVG